ncbi:thrombin inhibitor rhodniin-like [Anopheles maculipalpis]|uniref:thrombin inhibitor rhodniin-like n=1 Tax=Anopheles maculipalpis TaxID=1496333 RepID=UPI0021590CD8|nr:thrombin inhibitor rhodniin-like [Anopheles maculipalpis]
MGEKPGAPILVAPPKLALTTEKPCPCTRAYRPVCASDGKTYNNPCSYRCAKQLNRALRVNRQGRCEESELCCCTMIHRPVCGTNNRTYHNYCILRCMRLRFNEKLQMAHRWECGTTPSDWEEREIATVMLPINENIPPSPLGVFNDTVENWEDYAHLE